MTGKTMDEAQVAAPRRRRIRETRAMASGPSASSRHSSAVGQDIQFSPADINNAVRARRPNLSASRTENVPADQRAEMDDSLLDKYGSDDSDDYTGAAVGEVQARMREVLAGASPAYQKEYRLNLLHRFLRRGYALTDIAKFMGLSVSSLEKMRAELHRNMRSSAKDLNFGQLLSENITAYDEIVQRAMRMSDKETGADALPAPMRLAAMRTAMIAMNDRSRFLATAGVFDILRYRASDNGETESDVQVLMSRTREFIAGLTGDNNAAANGRVPGKHASFQRFGPDDEREDTEIIDL